MPGEAATLFLDGGTCMGALVKKKGRRRKAIHLRFANAHAALDWCIAHRARMVYLPPEPVQNN